MNGDLIRLIVESGLGPVAAGILIGGITFAACWNSRDRRLEVKMLLQVYEVSTQKFDLPAALSALRPPSGLGSISDEDVIARDAQLATESLK